MESPTTLKMKSMTKIEIGEAKTVGEWAIAAISRHSDKFLAHEAGVLADEDPEALHQMRVGMRRLRSAMKGFASAIVLPEGVGEKQVARIARILGQLRDLDVLRESLSAQRPHLPAPEQEVFDKAMVQMAKQRRKALKTVRRTLESKSYQKLVKELQKWLKEPQTEAIAAWDLDFVLPDLLGVEIGRYLLHPGWLVDRESAIADESGESLHDLRKTAKRTRYQMELFEPIYPQSYRDSVEQIEAVQEILGKIQDSLVQAEFLERHTPGKATQSLPTLMERLQRSRHQDWQQWLSLRQRFLEPQFRRQLRQVVESPQGTLAAN